MLKKVFGTKKDKPSQASLPQMILKVKETEDMLIKKQNYLESKIGKEVAVAKANAKKNKKAALEALHRKKRLEKQLQQLDGALTTLETQRDVLESANTNTAVLSSLSGASSALKSAHKNMNADKIDEIMDDLASQKDLADDISNAISNPVVFNEDVDEDELEQELAELELEDYGLTDQVTTLPTVPAEEIRTPNKTNKVPAVTKLKTLAS